MSGLESAYLGISNALDTNMDSLESLASPLLVFSIAYVKKQDAWQNNTIMNDVIKFLEESISSAPGAQSAAAQANEQKVVDESRMNADLSNTEIVIESIKTGMTANEDDLQGTMQAQTPLNGYLKSIVSLLARM